MRRSVGFVGLWFVALAALASFSCVSSGQEGDACRMASDCGNDFVCAYKIADGCGAKLACHKMPPTPGCDVPLQYCGCDGATVDMACGDSYTFKPVSGLATPRCPVPDASAP